MENRDRVEIRRVVAGVVMIWVMVACIVLLGSKCGGKVECQRLPDGTFSCSVETHRH